MKRIVGCLLITIVLVSLIISGCSSPASTSQSPTLSQPVTTQPATVQPTQAAASQDVIKIGHIRPLTGVMAMTSDKMVKAFDFAFEQVGYQVAGKKIQIIVGDSKGESATAIDVARKMVENDKVAMIVGPTQGGEEMAVSGYMNQLGIPVMFTNPEPAGVIMEKHKWTIGAGGTEPQLSSTMGLYAYEQLGYRKVNVITGDFTPGHGFLNAFMGAFKSKGGEIVQETYTPYPTQDFAPYLTVLKDADAVVAWIDGEQAIKLLSQYHELGINKRMPIVAAFHGSFFAPFILRALPPTVSDALIGRMTPTSYTALLDAPFNKKFVADFTAKFGLPPEETESGPYQGAMAIMEALKATNGDTTPEKLRQALVSVNFEGPEGPVKFDAETGSSIKTIYIVKINKQGNDFIWEPVHSYPDVSPMGF